MPLENASTIEQLDSTWPLGLDSSSSGDDHLRLLKAVLKAQFPGASGRGFSKPITVTEDQLNALPNQVADIGKTLFPVGSVVMRMDAVNPATLYGGTWQLITGDATITFGNGAVQSGVASGNNNPSVPLPRHGHAATFSGNQLPPHNHDTYLKATTQGGPNGWAPSTYNNLVPIRTSLDSAGTPSGSVHVQESGSDNATIDVRGARIAINVWLRTAL